MLLDVTSIAPASVLVLDSYFYVVVFHGTTVATWRKAEYHLNPEHAAFAQLLEVHPFCPTLVQFSSWAVLWERAAAEAQGPPADRNHAMLADHDVHRVSCMFVRHRCQMRRRSSTIASQCPASWSATRMAARYALVLPQLSSVPLYQRLG